MTRHAQFSDLVDIARSLLDARLDGDDVVGHFVIGDVDCLDRLNACLSDTERTGVYSRLDEEEIGLGMTVELRLSHPAIGFGLFAHSLDSLLKYPNARAAEPKRYLIWAPMFSNGDTEVPDIIQRYREMLSLVAVLARAAAYLDKDTPALLFISKGKFEVPVDYSEKDVEALEPTHLKKMQDIAVEDAQMDSRLSILSNAVCELLESIPKGDRFRFLLDHLGELLQKFEAAYKLFLSGFSYDKVRDQLEAARVEYTAKIHKVVTDIQNQLLGIPVATVIVATQMKDAKAGVYEFWVNTAVLVGCWIFAGLMVLLLRNQGHTLEVLAKEIGRQKEQLVKEYALIADRFAEVFDFLDRRIRQQKWVLRFIDGVVVVGLVLAHLVYFFLTPPARTWFERVVGG